MDVAIIAFDGFTDIDVFLPWDLLNRVDVRPWKVAILARTPQVTSVAGLTIPTHGGLALAAEARAVLVASGVGLRAALQDPAFIDALPLDPARQLIGSMCSGALALAHKGLLAGKRATTYPTQRARLAAMGVEVVEEPFVREGNIATAAGCLAALDLCGWMIEALAGAAQREMVLRSVQPVGRGLAFDDTQALPARIYAPAT
ncbi:MAG: DJ-1/PfpI family protein [Deltaproteobacteria bacterium]|nr:DJ-1/PfpI family protein [Deltaproteobacteria bacterium]